MVTFRRRWALVAWVSAVAWVPWALYLPFAGLVMPWGSWLEAALPTVLGLASGWAAWRQPERWERWIFVALTAQVIVLAFSLGAVLERPIHLETECSWCSLWEIQSSTIRIYLEKGQVGKGLQILWNDGVLPLAIVVNFATVLSIVLRTRRPWSREEPLS